MRMKAQRSFIGEEGSVRRGEVFEATARNAPLYQERGLAVPANKAEPAAPRNKAVGKSRARRASK